MDEGIGKAKERKTISIQKETIETLNKYRIGGESWDAFWRAMIPLIKQVRE